MNSSRLCAAWMAALACSTALPVAAETLAEIYALARQSDPKYLAVRSEYEATGFAVVEARAGLLPSVSWQYNLGKTNQKIVSSDNAVFAKGTSSYPSKERTLSASMPIFRLAVWRNWQQSKVSERQAQAALAASEQDLMVRTATAYLSVLGAQDAVGFAKAENESIKRQLDLASTKFRSGQATKVNLFDAQARLALKESDVIAAQNDLADKIQELREITGATASKLAPLPKEAPLVALEPADVDAWVQTSLNQNNQVQARTVALEVTEREIGKRRAAYYPTLDLSGSRDRKDVNGSLFGGGSDVKSNEIMLKLNVPLFDGLGTTAQVDQAFKHHETAQADLERDRRQVERQARAAYQGLSSGIVRTRALDQSVAAYESARQLKEEGYKAGISTVIGVIDAERDLYAAKRDAAQARYDYQLNALRLKQAAGSLNIDDLLLLSNLMPQ